MDAHKYTPRIIIADVHIPGSCLFVFQRTYTMGITRHLNSHSGKRPKLIKACNRLGRRGEGKGLGGEMEPCRSSLHRFGDRASPEQLTLLLRHRSRAESPHPHTPPQTAHTGEDFHGLAGTHTTGIPHSGNPSVTTKPWAGMLLPSLSRPSPPPAPREGSEDERLLVLQLRVVTGLHLQPPRLFQRVLLPALSDTCGLCWKQPGGGSHQS